MKMKTSSLGAAIRFALIASTAALISHSASAANYTWQGGTGPSGNTGGSGTWNATITNWTDGAGTRNQTWSDGNTALFGGSNSTNTITVSSNVSVAGISFTTDKPYTLNGGNITIDNGGTIYYGISGNNNSTLNTPLAGNNLNIGGFGASTQIGGNNTGLTGTVTVNFTGAGSRVVSLLHANAFGSGTAVNISSTGTQFNLGNNTLAADVSFNAGALSLSSGSALRSRGNGTMTYTGAITLAGNAAFQTIGGANTKLVTTNTVSIGANSLSLEAANAGLGFEIQGAIDGSGSVSKTGNRTVTFTAANTYNGTTTVSAGTLVLSGSGSINNSSLVSVAGGATLTNNTATPLTASLSLSENATINGSGSFDLASTPSLAVSGNLTDGFTAISIASATFNNPTTLSFTFASLGNVTDVPVFSGTALTNTFTTINVGGTPLDFVSGSTYSKNIGGVDYTFKTDLNTLTVAVPEPKTWALIGLGLGFTLFRMGVRARRLRRLSGRVD